jgi:hypothetical protein
MRILSKVNVFSFLKNENSENLPLKPPHLPISLQELSFYLSSLETNPIN